QTCALPISVVAAHEETADAVAVNDVVADANARGGLAGVLAGQLDADVAIEHGVALDEDVAAAVDVDAAGRVVVAVGGIAAGIDAGDDVGADDPVARGVEVRRGRGAFVADGVDADVVAVGDGVGLDEEALDVTVEHERLAGAEGEVVEPVAAYHKIGYGAGGVAVDRDAVGVAAVRAGVAGAKVVDVVVEQTHARAGAGDEDADRHAVLLRGAQPGELNPLDGDVADALQPEQGEPAGADDERGAVDHGRLARSGAKDDGRPGLARPGEGDPLDIDAGAQLHDVARVGDGRGAGQRAPRGGLVAGIRVVAMRGDRIQGGDGGRRAERRQQSEEQNAKKGHGWQNSVAGAQVAQHPPEVA